MVAVNAFWGFVTSGEWGGGERRQVDWFQVFVSPKSKQRGRQGPRNVGIFVEFGFWR